MKQTANPEKRDMTQFFLISMVLMTVVATAVAGYNYKQVRRYKVARARVIDGYPELQKLSLEIQRYESSGSGGRTNIRTQLQQIARGRGIEPEPIGQSSSAVGEFREHLFEVKIKGQTRKQILLYIHRVRRVIPQLTTKKMRMVGTPRSAPPGDAWDWKLTFAYRDKLKE